MKNLETILLSGELYNETKLNFEKLKVSGLTEMEEEDPVHQFALASGQFPGVYMSVVDENFVANRKIDYLSDVMLVFCPNLLKRTDFHYNKIDSNGYLNENNTLFNLEELENHLETENDILNEIVFHNPVSLIYLKEIWTNKTSNVALIQKLLANAANPDDTSLSMIIKQHYSTIKVSVQKNFIPLYEIECEGVPKLNGDYCYYLDSYQRDLINKPKGYPYSKKWYNRMANYCNIKKKPKDIYQLSRLFFQKSYTASKKKDVHKFRQFLLDYGVTQNLVKLFDEDLLFLLMNELNVVELSKLKLYSLYDYPD